MRRIAIALACASLAAIAPAAASADEPTTTKVPAAFDMPATLTLDDALRIFRTRGLDLLIADAAIVDAQGRVQQAAAIANPGLSVSSGPFFNYSDRAPCNGCSTFATTWGINDNAALFEFLEGKRGLRMEVARATLLSAKLARVDAQRTLEALVKQQYVQVALAKQTLAFNQELLASLAKSLEIARLRYPTVIDEGGLARIEVQKLEGDQAVVSSKLALDQARMGLAFFLGVRGKLVEFDVEKSALDFRVPPGLANATEQSLLRRAIDRRPDLRAAAYARVGADASLRLAHRQVVPDVDLSLSYTALGYGPGSPTAPVLTAGVAMNLPIFNQQQGAIRSAQASVAVASLRHAKTAAQVASDVDTAYVGMSMARKLVERMESRMLERARKARDIVATQFKAGSISLTDYLDAQRTYVATNIEYLQDLAAYWTAIYQLEASVGEEFRP
jgi:cobalt-zinc-cadmium efflux system outer membrane protein